MQRAETLLRPTPKVDPDKWAAENRVYPETSGVPGRRDPFLTPYAVPFARALSSCRNKRTVFVTGAQSGKTESFLDVIGARLDQRPAPILYAGPTRDFVTDQFEPRLMALFDDAATLKAKVARGKKSKKTLKWVSGVKVRLAWGGSSSALKSDPFALGIVDEYDEMLADVKGQGDPLGLIEARGITYADFSVGVASTPSRGLVDVERDEATGLEFWKEADTDTLESGIWKLWQEGTRFHWAWPCPQCDEYFIPRFKQLRWPMKCTPFEARTAAYLECPRCGGVIEEKHKVAMNERGVYVAPGQDIVDGVVVGDPPLRSTASFWVSGLASPFRSFGDRAEEYLLAVQSGEQTKIQTAFNAQFGEVYAPGGGEAPEWQEVYALRQPYHFREVPDGVRFLTAGVDVQKNRLIYVVRGWGLRQESWQIESGQLWGDTALDDVWTDLADLLHGDFDGRYIRRAFVDSGFKPRADTVIADHKVYEFCRANSRIAYATKGYASRQTPLTTSKIDVTSKGRKAAYGLEIALIDTDFAKSFVHQRIRWPSDQPGAWHLPIDADEAYCRQIVAEARVKGPSGRGRWVARSRENHFLDAEALAYMAAFMLGVERLGSGSRRGPPPSAPPAGPVPTDRPVAPSNYTPPASSGWLDTGKNWL